MDRRSPGARALRVYREPGPSGYRTSFAATGDEKVVAALLPKVVVAVSALFPA